MKLPILVYGVSGCGASIVIWTIKKILWPDLHTDDPLDSLNTAHNQSLCPHWSGQMPFNDVFSHRPPQDRVIHVEPSMSTVSYHTIYPSIMIRLETDKDVEQVALLCKHKIPNFSEEQLSDVKISGKINVHANRQLKHALNITVSELFYSDLHTLLDQFYVWCGRNKNAEYETIVNIHTRWRTGNNLILNI